MLLLISRHQRYTKKLEIFSSDTIRSTMKSSSRSVDGEFAEPAAKRPKLDESIIVGNNNNNNSKNNNNNNNSSSKNNNSSNKEKISHASDGVVKESRAGAPGKAIEDSKGPPLTPPPPPPSEKGKITSEGERGDLLAQVCSFIGIDEELRVEEDNVQSSVPEGTVPQGLYPPVAPEAAAVLPLRPPTAVATAASREFRTEATYVEVVDPRAQVRPPEARIPHEGPLRGPPPHTVWTGQDGRRYYAIGESTRPPNPHSHPQPHPPPHPHRFPATNYPELRFQAPYRQRFPVPPASYTLPHHTSLSEGAPRPPPHPHPLHYTYYARGPDFPPPPPTAAVTVAAAAYGGRFPLPGPPHYVTARFPRLPNGHSGSPQGHGAEVGDPHCAYPMATEAKPNGTAPVHPPHGLQSHDTAVTTRASSLPAPAGPVLRPQDPRADMVRPPLRPPEPREKVVRPPVQWIESQRVPTAVPSQRPYLQQQTQQEGSRPLDKTSPKEPNSQPSAPQLHPPHYPHQPSGDLSKSREQYRRQSSAELIPLGPFGHVAPDEVLSYHNKTVEPFTHHDGNTTATTQSHTKLPGSMSNVAEKPPPASCEVAAVDIERIYSGKELRSQTTAGGIRKIIKPPRPNVELIPLGPPLQKPATTTTSPTGVTSAELSSPSGYPVPYRGQPSSAKIVFSPTGRTAPLSQPTSQYPTSFPFPSLQQPTSQSSSPQSHQGITSPPGAPSQRQTYPFSTALPPVPGHYPQPQSSPNPSHHSLTSPLGNTGYPLSYLPPTSKATVDTTPPATIESQVELPSPVKIHIQPNPVYHIAQTVASRSQHIAQTEQLVSPIRSHNTYLPQHSAFPGGNTSKAPTAQSSVQQGVHSSQPPACTSGPLAPVSIATSQTTSASRAQSQEHSGESTNRPPLPLRSDTVTNKSSTGILPSTVAPRSPVPAKSVPESRVDSPRRNSASLEKDCRISRGSSDSLPRRSSSEHFVSDATPEVERKMRDSGNSGQGMNNDDTLIDVVGQDGRGKDRNPIEGNIDRSDHRRTSGEERPRSGAEAVPVVDITEDLQVLPETKVARDEVPPNERASGEVSGSRAQENHNPLSQPVQAGSSAAKAQSTSLSPSNPIDSRPPSYPDLSSPPPDPHSRYCHKPTHEDKVESFSSSGDHPADGSMAVVGDLPLNGEGVAAAKAIVDVGNHKAGETSSPGLRADNRTEAKDSKDNMEMCHGATEGGPHVVRESPHSEEKLMEVDSLRCIETVVKSVGSGGREKDGLRRSNAGIDNDVKNEKCIRGAQSQSRKSKKRDMEGICETSKQHKNNHLLSLTKAKNNEFYLKLKMVLTDLLTVPAALELRQCNLTPGHLLEKILIQCGLPVTTQGSPEHRMRHNFRSVVFHCMSQELLKSWGWTQCSTDKILDDLLELNGKGSTSGEDMRVDKVPFTARVDPGEGTTPNSSIRNTLGVRRNQQGSDEEADRIDRQGEPRMSTVPLAIHNLKVQIKKKKIGRQLMGDLGRQVEGVVTLGDGGEYDGEGSRSNSDDEYAPGDGERRQTREDDSENTDGDDWEWVKRTGRRYNLRITPVTDYRLLNEGMDIGMDNW